MNTDTTAEQLVAIGFDGWRVISSTGTVRGHIRREPTPSGERFHARRFDAALGAFRVLGSFWSRDEAVDCLRWS